MTGVAPRRLTRMMHAKRAMAALLLTALPTAAQQLPTRKPADPSPWNGSWKLDVQRSSPAAAGEGVPQVYRFRLGPGDGGVVPIQWEIPELGEVVRGATDGKPMAIRRTKPAPGMALAVRKEGSASLRYTVLRDGKLVGGGRMMLVDDGQAWVDLTWPDDREDLASELVYVKQ